MKGAGATMRILAPHSDVRLVASWQAEVTTCANSVVTRDARTGGLVVTPASNEPITLHLPRRCEHVNVIARGLHVSAQDKLEAGRFLAEASSVEVRCGLRADEASFRALAGSFACTGALEATRLSVQALHNISAGRIMSARCELSAGQEATIRALYSTEDVCLNASDVAIHSLHCCNATVQSRLALLVDSLTTSGLASLLAGTTANVHVDLLPQTGHALIRAQQRAQVTLSLEALPCRLTAPDNCNVELPAEKSAAFESSAGSAAPRQGLLRSLDAARPLSLEAPGLLTIQAPQSSVSILSWVEGVMLRASRMKK